MSLEMKSNDQFNDPEFKKQAKELVIEAARGLALHDVRVSSILGAHTVVFRDDVVGGSEGYNKSKDRAIQEAGLQRGQHVTCSFRDPDNPSEFVGATRAMPK